MSNTTHFPANSTPDSHSSESQCNDVQTEGERDPSKVNRRHNDYTSHSRTYDEKRFAGRNNEYLEKLRFRAMRYGLEGCDRSRPVLDIGCGTGRGLEYLANLGFTNIIGLDYTEAMLDVARKKIAGLPAAANVELRRGDAFALPFADQEFATVISLNFLHMFRIDLQGKLIQEMARVCQNSGHVAVELDSIHKGLFVSRYLEQRRVQHRTKFNSIWEMTTLFPQTTFSSRKTYGTALPVLYRLFSMAPNVGAFVESVTLSPPLNWLAERVIISARRA